MADSRKVDADVADVFARIEAKQASASDVDAVVAWAAQRPDKLDQFASLAATWHGIGRARPNFETRPGLVRPSWRAWLATAAAALLIVGAVFLLPWRSSTLGSDHYATQVGELREIVLADGSAVHMNGNSALAVSFGSGERRVRLERGEAFFEVARDPGRAFLVEAGKVVVQALGTTFNVDYSQGEVAVTVTEGAVRVAPIGGASTAHAGAIAHAGERILAGKAAGDDDAAPGVKLVAQRVVVPAQASASVGWREGVLYLNGESLAAAVDHINRQSVRQVAIADLRLRELPIYGSFRLSDVESFVKAVEVLYPVRHVETRQGYLLTYDDD